MQEENITDNSKPVEVEQPRKRLAPPPPVITNIDQRIKSLEEKGKKRGKRNSWIGLLSSSGILLVVFIAGYYLLGEINNITNRVEVDFNFSQTMVSDPDGYCSVEDDCCLTSLSRSRKRGLMLIDELGVCPEGSVSNQLKCATSLTWCEPSPESVIEEPAIEIDSVDIDISSWSIFESQDFGFLFSYPDNFIVISDDLQSNDLDIRKVYVTDNATSTDYYFILKIIANNSSSTLEEHIAAQEKVLNELASTSGIVSDMVSEDYRTENILGKKIIVTTDYEGDLSVSEEVLIAGKEYIYAISYPSVDNSYATSSQIEQMRGIITSFKNIPKRQTEIESDTGTLDENNDEPREPVDTDGDGLSDNEEIIYLTDPNNIDTDGDGFSDGDEVKNGYNPIGDGLL